MTFFSLSSVLLLSLFVSLSLCAPSAISECQSFTTGGEYYLVSHLFNSSSSSSCLSFHTSEPVIIDGRGYSINVSLTSLEISGASSVVLRNLIVRRGRIGVQLSNTLNAQIINVSISGVTQGIVIYNSTSSVTLSDNRVDATSSSVLVSRSSYASIQNNAFSGGNGVLLDNIVLLIVSNNQIRHSIPLSSGVKCATSCGIFTIENNILLSTVSATSGFELVGTSFSIKNNEIQGYNTGLSIRGVTASSSASLEHNSIFKFNSFGIAIYLTYATINNNIIASGRGEGLFIESPDFGAIIDGNTLFNISADSSTRAAAIKVSGQFSIIRNNIIQNTRGIISMMLFQAASHTVQNNLIENVEVSGQQNSIYSLFSSIVFENNVVRDITHTSCDSITVVNFQSMETLTINNCTITNLLSPIQPCRNSLVRGLYTRARRNIAISNSEISHFVVASALNVRAFDTYDEGNTTITNVVVSNISGHNTSTSVTGIRVSRSIFIKIDNVKIENIKSGSGDNTASGLATGLDVISAATVFMQNSNISHIKEGEINDSALCKINNVKSINFVQVTHTVLYQNMISNIEAPHVCNVSLSGSNVTWPSAPAGCSINAENYCSVGSADCCVAATCTLMSHTTVCRAGSGCNAPEYCTMGTCPSDTGCDECATNTDECHARAVCFNTAESYYCNCSAGYFGDGFSCDPYCGDGKCDATSETCVSCPHDCTAPCDLCGDGYCGQNETCTSCHMDCGDCNTQQCRGSPPCSGNGACGTTGACTCHGSWSGPYCDAELLPISVEANENQPSAVVRLLEHPQWLTYQIQLNRIEERNPAGFIVDLLHVSQTNFSRFVDDIYSPSFRWLYNASYPNDVNISVSIWQFEASTNFKFANTEQYFNPHSVKMNVRVDTWPFKSFDNNLVIVLDVTTSNTESLCVLTNEDEAKNLNWQATYYEDFSFYATYHSYAVLDGLPKNISFKGAGNTVTAILPHFWTYAEVDPSFSVLSGSNGLRRECTGEEIVIEKKKTDLRLLALILLPVLAGIVLIALAIIVVRKLKFAKELRKTRELMSIQSSSSSITPGGTSSNTPGY